MDWTDERPKEPGWYWVFQPGEHTFPCRGRVFCVLVEKDHRGLVAWVPGMDYADPVQDLEMDATWDSSRWMGPIEPPMPPRRGE